MTFYEIGCVLESFLLSIGIVALAEIGDKTQLLAFLLAARFQRPLPIIAGIFLATVLNHGLAGAVGVWVTQQVDADVLRWVLGLGFLAMAAWTLIPDQIEDDETHIAHRLGVFGATVVTFFLAEMGDKTQIATVALAAKFDDPVSVIMGTTLGMMVANVPAVYAGDKFGTRIPMRWVHAVAALVFVALGVVTLFGLDASVF